MIHENRHQRRLKRQGLRIVTEYFDEGRTKLRSSDGVRCDDVKSGVILDKKYLRGDRIVHQETEFNPGLLYAFVYPKTEDGMLQCPCCTGVAPGADFADGCPYCGSAANLEYDERREGERDHADSGAERPRTLLWLLLCVAGSVAVCTLITYAFSRTRLFFDGLKGALIGLFVGLGAFLVKQSTADAAAQRREEERRLRQNAILQSFIRDLVGAGLSLKTFHNGLSAELNRRFYDTDDPALQNVTDFDILDVRDQKLSTKERACTLTALVQLRIVSAEDDELTAQTSWWRVRLQHDADDPVIRLRGGFNMIECPHCGAKVSLEEATCRYCGSPVLLKRPLTLTEIVRVR